MAEEMGGPRMRPTAPPVTMVVRGVTRMSTGVRPETLMPEHEILDGIRGEWPRILGYNKTVEKSGTEVLASVCGDPFLAVGSYGKGRSAVLTTDCAPHWAPPEFCEWEGYERLFANLAAWLIK